MKIYLFITILVIASVLGAKAQQEENTIRMMSFNIHNGIGMDGQADYGRIAAVINQSSPDVVALQELDSATLRNDGKDLIKELANRTLMHRIYAAAIDYQGGKYGIGILSKEKPLNHRIISLPGQEEKRALLLVEFDKYVFCCTHFSLTEADRLASVPLLLAQLTEVDKPVFVAGDFNAEPESATIKLLKEKFRPLLNTKNKTSPADEPKEYLDYIFGYNGSGNGYTVVQSAVINESMASDHRPIYADVRLKASAADIFRTKPYLQNPVGNGITVAWLTHVPVYSWVEYGTDPKNLKRAHTVVDGQVISNNFIHKIRLENLTPGIPYYYRVCSKEITLYQAYYKEFGETAESEIQTFTLPSDKTSDFTVLVFNDLHKQHATLDALCEQVKDVKYDFVIFNGDVIDDPKNEQQAVTSLSYYNNKVGADRIPVFYLRGNHEIRNAYSIQLRELFDYVGDKTYGAFNWGDTRFVLLDCGEDKADSSPVFYGLNDFAKLLNDQTGFLKKEFASKEFKKAEKRILVHHVPLFGKNKGSYTPGLQLWGDMLAKAPLHISINAHTHEFEYLPQGKDGNHYPVVIGGGYSKADATVMILQKKGSLLNLKVLDCTGKELLNQNF